MQDILFVLHRGFCGPEKGRRCSSQQSNCCLFSVSGSQPRCVHLTPAALSLIIIFSGGSWIFEISELISFYQMALTLKVNCAKYFIKYTFFHLGVNSLCF